MGLKGRILGKYSSRFRNVPIKRAGMRGHLYGSAVAGFVFSLFVSMSPVKAVPLNPMDFTALGSFNPGSDVFVNTDAMTMTGGASFSGVSGGGAAVFTFTDIVLSSSSLNIFVTGNNPFAFLSQSDATIGGIISFSGVNPGDNGGNIEIGAYGTLFITSGGQILSAGAAGTAGSDGSAGTSGFSGTPGGGGASGGNGGAGGSAADATGGAGGLGGSSGSGATNLGGKGGHGGSSGENLGNSGNPPSTAGGDGGAGATAVDGRPTPASTASLDAQTR